MVYSTRRFVVCLSVCHFVLVFFSPFSIAITSLGEERELILVLFVRLFGLCLFRFVGFLFLLGSGKGCGLWLWHSLDFSLTFLIPPSFGVSGRLWLWHMWRLCASVSHLSVFRWLVKAVIVAYVAFVLQTLLQQGKAKPEFYGDVVYRLRKIVGKSNFSEQFRKLINRYKRIGYSLDIMRQTACLVVNPIIVDCYTSLFNCTTAVRASDSLTASS